MHFFVLFGGFIMNNYKFTTIEEVEIAELRDPDIFKRDSDAFKAAIDCVERCLAKSQRSYEMAARAFPGSPMNVYGTKRASESIQTYMRWLAAHPVDREI